MLTADNLLQLEAGMQPRAQCYAGPVGKELLPGSLKPQREGVYGGTVSHFPKDLPLMFILLESTTWHPCSLCTIKINDLIEM